MREPQGAVFPVAAEGAGDLPFGKLAKDLGQLIELQLGLGRVNGTDRAELERMLRRFCFGARGAEGELERRLNGTAPPLVSDEGKLDSFDCCAVAHEVRRKRGAESAIVIAFDSRARVHIGCAVKPGSPTELLEARLMEKIDEVAHDFIEDVVLDLVVPEPGQPS